MLYAEQGCYIEAEPLYVSALEMSKRVLGKEHPWTKTMQGNLQNCLDKKEQWAYIKGNWAMSL